jgi:hypothetical protein
LKYLISCALPEGQALYTVVDGVRYDFPGTLGLAPKWADQGLMPSEQRWVSACIFALTNVLGRHIRPSLRAMPAIVPGLDTTSQEEKEYSIYEGDFFGNLFLPEAVAYACRGARSTEENSDPILKLRLCTAASGKTTPSGKAVSVCDFIINDQCGQPGSHTIDGVEYKEVIRVYLKPGLGSVQP